MAAEEESDARTGPTLMSATAGQHGSAPLTGSAEPLMSHRGRVLGGAGSVIKGATGFAVIVGLWELALAAGVIKRSAAPTIGQFVAAVRVALDHGALSATLGTTETWAITLAVSIVLGVVIGLATGLSRWMNSLTSIVFDFIRPVPPIALLPAVILIAGIGQELEVIVGITGAIWPVMLGAHYGVTHTDPLMLDTGRSMQARRSRLVMRIVLPSALPSIVTGIRIAAAIALAVDIGVELVGATGSGLGHYIATATSAGATDQAFAGAFLAAVLGLTITGAFVILERRLLPWAPSSR